VPLPRDAMDLPRPFGPYLLLRRLAVGGMAEVYVAKAKGIGGFEKLVAIKVIHPRLSEDEHFIEMLVEEAKLSVLLTHVNIAQTFDLGCIDETYFIVMEFIEGADTYRILKRANEKRARLPVDLCAYMVSEVCHGLDYAHRKRDVTGAPLHIVHRDISPQNVLVSFAGEVKIVDFGIAKAALRKGETEAGVIKGKYYYMSPEQAWADPVDRRSDIFSAGLVLHEMLTGEMVYQEDNLPKLLDLVRKADVPPPSAVRKGIPKQLDDIVVKALAKAPEDRYQSGHDFGQALTQFLYQHQPSFTAARLSSLMAQLFPSEIEQATGAVRMPSEQIRLLSSIEEIPTAPTTTTSASIEVMRPDEFLAGEKSVIFDLPAFEDSTSRELPTGSTTAQRPAPPAADEDEDDDFGDPTVVSEGLAWDEPTVSARRRRPVAPAPDESWEDATLVESEARSFARMRQSLERKVAAERRSRPPPPRPPSQRPTPQPPGKRSAPPPVAAAARAGGRAARAVASAPGALRIPPPARVPAAMEDHAELGDHQVETQPRAPRRDRPPTPSVPWDAMPQQAPRAAPPQPSWPPAPSPTPAPVQSWPPAPVPSRSPGTEHLPDLSGTFQDDSAASSDPFAPAPQSVLETYRLPALQDPVRRKRTLLFGVGLLVLAVTAGAVTRLVLAPDRPPPAELEVRSVPEGARVFLDGRQVPGLTPVQKEAFGNLEPGRTYSLRVELEGHDPWTKEFEARSGAVAELAFLQPREVDLTIDTVPAGAQVYIDDVLHGSAPQTLSDQRVGRVLRLKAVRDELVVEQSVTVSDDMERRIVLRLPLD